MSNRHNILSVVLALILLTVIWDLPAEAQIGSPGENVTPTAFKPTMVDTEKSKKLPVVSIIADSGLEKTGKVLYVTDSVLVLWQKGEIYNADRSDESATLFSYSEITEIKVRKRGSAGGSLLKGMGYGVLIGGGIGALGGLAGGDDQSGFIRFSAEAKALFGFVVCGASGALIGGIVGVASKHTHWYFVGGDWEMYQETVPTLRQCAIFPDRASFELFQRSHKAGIE